MDFVVVGSGPAAVFAVEAIRKRDQESRITLVTADPHGAHSPVMLSYWMAGGYGFERLFFRDPSWSERMKIDLRVDSRGASLQPASKKLVLDKGGDLGYDRLLIATGAVPISLRLSGIDAKGVTSFRTLRDAETLLEGEGSDGVKRIVIIGGGFIGLKLACHLKERGLEVSVLEKERKLAFRMLDQKASDLIEKKLRGHGIAVETGVEAKEVLSERGWVSGVQTKDGRLFHCQRLVQAVGVKPNVQWLEGSGIGLRGGILVDERMRTNLPDVYGAGDVTITLDSITGEPIHNATWPAATRQGIVAGTNMAGGNLHLVHNFALNALNLFGLQVMAAGSAFYDEPDGVEIVSEEEGDVYRKKVIKGDRLIGFILIGDVSEAGYLLSRMKKGDEFPLKSRAPCLCRGSFRRHLPPHLGFRHGVLFGDTV